MRRLTIVAVALLTALLMATPAQAIDEVNTKRLRNAVTVNGILAHERVLQRIANQNGGTRASGTPGFDASAAYVKGRLEAAGYTVTEQEFIFPFFKELSPAVLAQVTPTPTTYETGTFDFAGTGDVTGQVFAAGGIVIPATPEPSSASGCAPEDFAPAPAGPAVALVQRGTCTFGDKAANAEAAGYDAVIIFNEGNPGREELFIGTLGRPFDIPVVGLSFADAAALYAQLQAGPVTVHVTAAGSPEPAWPPPSRGRRQQPDPRVREGATTAASSAGHRCRRHSSGHLGWVAFAGGRGPECARFANPGWFSVGCRPRVHLEVIPAGSDEFQDGGHFRS